MFCNGEDETLVHLMRNCPRTTSIQLISLLGLRGRTDTWEHMMDWVAKLASDLSRDNFDLCLVLI